MSQDSIQVRLRLQFNSLRYADVSDFSFFFKKTKLDQKTGRLSLDIKSILDDCRDITIENDWIVYNLPKVPKQEAAENLHEVLVKGLFIYFLAKFAHGPVFRVKLEYYIVSSNLFSKDLIVVISVSTGCGHRTVTPSNT